MRDLFRTGQQLLGGSSASQRTRWVRLLVERLEDRCLPSGGYLQTNLVSDLPGLARVTDPNLVNPWGLSAAPTGPFWVSDNGTGVSTLYDGQGQAQPSVSPLIVGIPGPAGSSMGTPTGTVFNGGPGFLVSANGRSGSSLLLFATEDGLLAGWNPNVDASHAVVAVDNSSTGADYKGLALGTDSSGRTLLYATNFSSGTVDVFDQAFQAVHLTGSFIDPTLPAGYAPFGIQNIDGNLYITYARQDAAKYDTVAVPVMASSTCSMVMECYSGDSFLRDRSTRPGDWLWRRQVLANLARICWWATLAMDTSMSSIRTPAVCSANSRTAKAILSPSSTCGAWSSATAPARGTHKRSSSVPGWTTNSTGSSAICKARTTSPQTRIVVAARRRTSTVLRRSHS